MIALRFLPLLLAACDPIWSARVTLRDPSQQPVDKATVSLDCSHSETYKDMRKMSSTTDAQGKAAVVGTGTQFPVDCDVVIAKPGFAPSTIAYRELCPKGPDGCDRVFDRAVTLQPQAAPAP